MRKNDDGLRFLSFRVGEIKTITLVFWNYTFFHFEVYEKVREDVKVT